ncbi:hypothetical protein EP331_10950 [bacterium]|nr:MAG: hypothetical protein EP331_10950 [bacterium]
MNPFFKSNWWLYVVLLLPLLISALFIPLNRFEEIQLIGLFVIGLSLPTMWVYLFFPVSNFHYWHLYTPSKIIFYLLFRVRFFLFFWVICVLICTWVSHLLPAFLIVPPALFVLNSIAFWGVGHQSLLWRTGKRGNKIRAFAKETGQLSSPMGSIPTLVRTIISSFFSILIITQSLSLNLIQVMNLLVILFSICGLGLFLLTKSSLKARFIPTFVSDNAFYDEYFLVQDSIQSMKPVPAESLFWIPAFMRTRIRYLLTQHLRIRSTSRIYLGISIIVWILALISPDWFDADIALGFILLSLLFEFHLFFDETMGSFGLHQKNQFTETLITHFLIAIRWLPVTAISLFLLDSFNGQHIELLLFILLFTFINSFMQAIYHHLKSKKRYG